MKSEARSALCRTESGSAVLSALIFLALASPAVAQFRGAPTPARQAPPRAVAPRPATTWRPPQPAAQPCNPGVTRPATITRGNPGSIGRRSSTRRGSAARTGTRGRQATRWPTTPTRTGHKHNRNLRRRTSTKPLTPAAGALAPSPLTLTLGSIDATPEAKAKARAEAQAFFALKVSAKEAATATKKVKALHWHKTLDAAARRAKREKKPILWIQALGDVKGHT